jgi:hypothetical protein
MVCGVTVSGGCQVMVLPGEVPFVVQGLPGVFAGIVFDGFEITGAVQLRNVMYAGTGSEMVVFVAGPAVDAASNTSWYSSVSPGDAVSDG